MQSRTLPQLGLEPRPSNPLYVTLGNLYPINFTNNINPLILQLDGTFSSQDKEYDEVDGQIIDSEVAWICSLC